MSAAVPVMIGTQLLGAGLGAYGASEQSKSQRDALLYSSEVNKKNAQYLTDEWLFNEENAISAAKQKVSSTKAQISEAGLIGSVSAASALMKTQDNTERDVLALRMKYVNQIDNYKKQSELDRQTANKVAGISYIGIAANLLSGASGSMNSLYSTGAFF